MFLFGGERDALDPVPPEAMRQLDLRTGTWSDLQTTGPQPASRLTGRGLLGGRAVVDPEEDVLLALCDCSNGSAHLLDLSTGGWSRAPGDRPLGLIFPILVYDPAGDRALLFGGDEHGEGTAQLEGWAYDLSAARRGWTALPRMPAPLLFPSAAFDPDTRHLLVFGGQLGQEADGRVVDRLWRIDLGAADPAWQEITSLAGAAPPARMGATLTFAPSADLAVLYGGYDGHDELGDVWALDYADPAAPRWASLSPAFEGPGPGERSGHSAVWDGAGNRILYYGGLRNTFQVLQDTWALDLSPLVDPGPTDTPGGATPTATPIRTPRMPTPTATPEGGAPIFLPWSAKEAVDPGRDAGPGHRGD
jgi:hypothetical protein